MTTKNSRSPRFILAATALTLLALYLRLRLIDTTGLWSDQAFTLGTAMRWVNGGAIPLASNKSSVGFINPPMIEYLYGLALAFKGDILAVAYLTLIGGVGAVLVTIWTANKLFDPPTALAAGLLMAVNPWAVYYSQLIWNQTMVPLFSALMFGLLVMYLVSEQRPWLLVGSIAAAAIMTQVHPASIIQLGSYGLLLLFFWRRVKILPLLVGGALFLLLYLPYFLYEINVGWADLAVFVGLAGEPAGLSPAALLVSLDLLHGKGLLLDPAAFRWVDGLATLFLAAGIVAALGLIWQGYRSATGTPHRRRAEALLAALVWFVVPLLFYLRTTQHLQVYYLISQWPVHFLLMGVGIVTFFRGTARLVPAGLPRWAAAAAVALLLAIFALGEIALTWTFQNQRLANPFSDMQIRHVRQAVENAEILAGARPNCTLVVLATGAKVETSDLSLLREFTRLPQVVLADADLALPLPAGCTLYLLVKPDSKAGAFVAGALPEQESYRIEFPGRMWQFFEAIDTAALPLDHENWQPAAEAVVWVNGAQLESYRLTEDLSPGAPLSLSTLWVVNSPPGSQVFHFGNYLLTAENAVVAQADGPGFDSIQWRVGDRFITWFDLPVPADLPPGDYQIGLAFYSWPDIVRTDLTDGTNTAFIKTIPFPSPGG